MRLESALCAECSRSILGATRYQKAEAAGFCTAERPLRSKELPIKFIFSGTLLCLGLILSSCSTAPGSSWSAREKETLASLSLSALPALPADPSNAFADDNEAADLGHALFFDTRLSQNGQVSCATCHDPLQGFSDGLPLAKGIGTMNRHTPTVVGAAYSPWQFWDGRKDSLWAQALGPLEQPVEHGLTRGEVEAVIVEAYAEPYRAVFGPLPDLTGLPRRSSPLGDASAQAAWQALSPNEHEAVTRVFVNVGKAVAAYERQLSPEPTRFDAYVEAVLAGNSAPNDILSPEEEAGLRLFIGAAGCVTCHSGPRLTDDSFHNTGVPAVAGLPEDLGRETGAKLVARDEFNCLSAYSDATPSECRALSGLEPAGPPLERAYKVPSLRDVAAQPPYMHAGQFGTLVEVLNHYNRAPEAVSGQSELEPLGLSDTQLRQLEAFLTTLSAEDPPR